MTGSAPRAGATVPDDAPVSLDYTRTVEKPMPDCTVDALIVDLLLWLSDRERTYQDVIDVWRTSCPKLPVWEDAKDRGFVAQDNSGGRELVRVTPAGSEFLHHQRASRGNPART